MRLGESCARRGEEARRDLDGPGVVGVAGTDGQSSDRLSSHGSLPISSFEVDFVMMRPRRRASHWSAHDP